jgi:DNA invertase Pin-like site-specific DNA recombinase
LILRFLLLPSPRGFDRADHGLAASVDVHMLDRHLLLKAGFRSLGDAWADTTSAHGRLMLTVLGGLAEFERELIKSRTGEGRARAKARGARLGRKPMLTLHQRRLARESQTEIARSYNVSHSTIGRLGPT